MDFNNGFCIQCGLKKGNGTVTFPITFSNKVMSVLDSIYYNGNSSGWDWHLILSEYPITNSTCYLAAADNDWHYWAVFGF